MPGQSGRTAVHRHRRRRPCATQSSSSATATDSSTGCTGVRLVTPVSRPASAAGSDGSSNWTTTAQSSRRATSARWTATPSASDPARSRTAPGSVIARCPLASSSCAASVIGPGACTLTVRCAPRRPAFSHASSSASMSSASRLTARRVTALRPAAMRYPRGTVSMAMSTSSAPARPMRSAPIPRAGSSTRCGSRCSSPTTISAASRADVPGQDPMPVRRGERTSESLRHLANTIRHTRPTR